MDDESAADAVARGRALHEGAARVGELLAKLKIEELSVAVAGDRGDGRVTITGIAPTTMEREYATAILEAGGWRVDNALTAAAPADPARVRWLADQAKQQFTAGNLDGACRLARALAATVPNDPSAQTLYAKLQQLTDKMKPAAR